MHNKSFSIYIFAAIQKTVYWASCSIRLVDIYRKSHCSPTLKPSHKMSLSKINSNTCVSLWFLACSKSYWIVHWGCWDHYNSGSTVASSRVILLLLSIFFLFSRSSSSLPPTLLFSFCLEITGNASEVCFIEHPSLSLSLSLMCCIGDGARGESTEREGNYGSLASERGGGPSMPADPMSHETWPTLIWTRTDKTHSIQNTQSPPIPHIKTHCTMSHMCVMWWEREKQRLATTGEIKPHQSETTRCSWIQEKSI